MSNFSDSSQRGASSESEMASEMALQAGLAALNQKDYREAIAQLESIYPTKADPATYLKAQVGLVKAYAQFGQIDRAIDLCQPLCNSSSLQVKTWAAKTLEQLSHRATARPALRLSESTTVSTAPQPDETGFVPLSQTPAPSDRRSSIEQSGDDATGFVPLTETLANAKANNREIISPTPTRKQNGKEKPANQEKSASQDKSDGKGKQINDTEDPFAAEMPDLSAAETAIAQFHPRSTAVSPPSASLENAAENTAAESTADSSETVLQLQTALQINTQQMWRQAGRAQKWASLGAIDRPQFWRSKLWAVQILTIIVLLWLMQNLLPVSQTLLNWISLQITWQHWMPFLSYTDPTWLVLPAMALLFIASPWLLDKLLKRFYSLKPFSLAQLEQYSPESVRLLKRVCGQRRQPVPVLGLLPATAPLALTYGYLPGNARIAVSQGLLNQLNDDEIATLYAGELGHITHWDFGVLSWVTLVAQIPYLVYWQVADWGDRQRDRVLQSVAVAISSFSYGLYRLCRLPGLWLSRMRLYYSDRTATELTGNPNALVRGLLKIAIGTAQDIERWSHASYLQEGFDLLTPVGYRSALSFGSAYVHTPTPALLEWEQHNPSRHWLVINNSHLLLGDRLHLLTRYAHHWRLETELNWDQKIAARNTSGTRISNQKSNLNPSRTSILPLTPAKLMLQGSPCFGALIGLGLASSLWALGWIADKMNWLALIWLWGDQPTAIGCVLLGFSFGLFLQINPFFPDIKRSNLQINPSLSALLINPNTLLTDSQPIRMQGKLLGRRGFSNRLHQDLMLHTPTGSIRLHYTSQWGPLGNVLSQSLRPSALMNAPVTVTGWFHRGAIAWIDVETIQAQRGITIRSKQPVWSTILACLAALLGAYIILQGG